MDLMALVRSGDELVNTGSRNMQAAFIDRFGKVKGGFFQLQLAFSDTPGVEQLIDQRGDFVHAFIGLLEQRRLHRAGRVFHPFQQLQATFQGG